MNLFQNELNAFYQFFAFMLGACFGSFANVIIYRLPNEKSIIRPRSFCYACKKNINWYDNVPILAWIWLRGRCRHCQSKISIRYPLVELLGGILFLLAYIKFHQNWFFFEVLIFLFGLLVCTFIDFDHMILPDEFTLSGIVIGLIGAAINPERSFVEALLGVLLGGGFLWMMAYIYLLLTGNEGMGGGDIKLLAWIGALVGWKAIPFVIMSSAIIGSIVGIAFSLKSKEGLKTAIPFGPYLALGAVLFLFGSEKVAEWYFNLFLPGF